MRSPNVVLLLSDQQSWNMMACAGNPWLQTPAMDTLAESGIRFELSYATNSVCAPSRVSLLTGRMPSASGINANDDSFTAAIPDSHLRTSLGAVFSNAGYDTVYGGKLHLPRALRDQFNGDPYRVISSDERDDLAADCAEYIAEPHDRPFLLIASLIHPHDICYHAINSYRESSGLPRVYDVEDTALELLEEFERRAAEPGFWENECPPLPANHEIADDENPAFVRKYVESLPFRKHARSQWSEREWRAHSWIYHRLTERLDAQVGVVVEAIRRARLEENTIVVLTSDHGDLNGAHRLEHKSTFHEESTRVPFLLSHPGKVPAGRVDGTHLVSNGLDLLPTLCELAEIPLPPVAYDGMSLAPIARAESRAAWRDFLVVESERDRMVRSARFAYSLHGDAETTWETLYDLGADPGQMRDLASDTSFHSTLQQHRAFLGDWCQRTWDYDGLVLMQRANVA